MVYIGIGDNNTNQDKILIIKEIEKIEIDHLITEIENNPSLIDYETFEILLEKI